MALRRYLEKGRRPQPGLGYGRMVTNRILQWFSTMEWLSLAVGEENIVVRVYGQG